MIDRTEIALRTGTNLWIPGLLIAIVVSLAIIIICTVPLIAPDREPDSDPDSDSDSGTLTVSEVLMALLFIVSVPVLLGSGIAVLIIHASTPNPGEYAENNQYILISGYDWRGRYEVIDTGEIMKATGVPVHMHSGKDDRKPSADESSILIDWIDADGMPHRDGRIIYNGNRTISMYDEKGYPIHRQDGSALKDASIPMGDDWPGYLYSIGNYTDCGKSNMPSWNQYDYGIKDKWAHGHGFGGTGEAFVKTTDDNCNVTVFSTKPPFPDSTIDAGHVRVGNLLRKRWIMEFGGRIYTMPYDGHGGVLS